MSRMWIVTVLLVVSACSHTSEVHSLYGPIFVDQTGVDLVSEHPIKIQGRSNELLITIPVNLHPNYESMKLVDSTNSSSTEFFADVYLSTGQVYTFSTRGLPGFSSHPERVISLHPPNDAKLTGNISRIRLRSSRPAVVPKILFESWNQGI